MKVYLFAVLHYLLEIKLLITTENQDIFLIKLMLQDLYTDYNYIIYPTKLCKTITLCISLSYIFFDSIML